MFASHRGEKPADAPPAALVPTPAKVGQWALYRETRGRQERYLLASITRDETGVWIEYEYGSAAHRVISKVAYSDLPDLSKDIRMWRDSVELVVSQADDGEPMLVDLRDGRNPRTRPRLDIDKFHELMDGARWRHDDLPRQNVRVAAGTFRRAVRVDNHAHTLTTWFHPAVPITAMVGSRAIDGSVLELVAYGEAGARSAIPDVPGTRAYIECREQPITGSNLPRMQCRPHDTILEDRTALLNMFAPR